MEDVKPSVRFKKGIDIRKPAAKKLQVVSTWLNEVLFLLSEVFVFLLLYVLFLEKADVVPG